VTFQPQKANSERGDACVREKIDSTYSGFFETWPKNPHGERSCATSRPEFRLRMTITKDLIMVGVLNGKEKSGNLHFGFFVLVRGVVSVWVGLW
jgi:hypothetical protein